MGELIRNFNFLKENGFNVAEFGFAKTIGDAIDIADRIGYPIVLKIPSQMHKSKVGGVLTNIHNLTDLKTLSKDFVDTLEERGVFFDGLIVQKQIKGVELIVGLKEDKVFGRVILLGSGGTLAEMINDVTFRVCPITERDAVEMVGEIKAKALLSKEGVSLNELTDLLVKVSKINIKEMDLNPVICNSNGCWIVDARILKV
ncbi:MAG: acetate--CoA ligase family protein [Nanoarchaeota archaeon]|nr:acetate--CoA ligase family protein [Nanoarchaeota archaeon]